MALFVAARRHGAVVDGDREIAAVFTGVGQTLRAVLVAGGNHPHVALFQCEFLAVALAINPVAGALALENQPGFVVVMEVFFAFGEFEAALEQAFVQSHNSITFA